MTPEGPLQFFFKIYNGMDVKKSQRAHLLQFLALRFFKRNNFRFEIRFSQAQHAISDFLFFFERPVFFLCDFQNLFSPKLLNFYQKRNVLRALRIPQGFRHYATYRRPSKKFRIFFSFSVFFLKKKVFR